MPFSSETNTALQNRNVIIFMEQIFLFSMQTFLWNKYFFFLFLFFVLSCEAQSIARPDFRAAFRQPLLLLVMLEFTSTVYQHV